MDHKLEFGGMRSTTEGKMALEAFSERHGITAAPNLTVVDDEIASLIVERLEPRIAGKTVVEIGVATAFFRSTWPLWRKRSIASRPTRCGTGAS